MTEKKEQSLLKLSSAPHIGSNESIVKIMWMVVIALLPSSIYSVYLYGMNSFLLLVIGVLSAVITEAVFQLLMKQKISAHDGSAAITGLLVAMNVPPESPLWMVAIGSVFAIVIVKQLFGGLGFNIFNPALAARAFLMASWPVHMTTKWHNFSANNVLAQNINNEIGVSGEVFDVITQATPLTILKEGPELLGDLGISTAKLYELLLSSEMLKSLALGNVGGVIGETSALFLLVGGVFLLIRKIITWHIPVSYIGTVGILCYIYYYFVGSGPVNLFVLFHLLSGGLFLGAFFMATDMTTSPISGKGMVVFGMGCGVLTFVIRVWGGYPEGVSYSILLMNAVVPIIDRLIKPKVFGKSKLENNNSEK